MYFLAPVPLRPRDSEESLAAELFRLAEEQGRPWMTATARDVLWLVVAFLLAVKAINFLFWWAKREVKLWIIHAA
ncbi:uncharacterized protein N7518_005910 [Penicillium psychrosexuale]|uniref:uncharacterized protein n=1 Tax=Penicillium psychrosexuale TaxID=1002107 RepID=UPI002545B670|nr:uncharacterized protein N7518_005910 [Penicillium psychrosexuale]KAJ5788899.1 hypothetical protein N7518_005910 [Penicillium psychrosexuale]